MPPEQRVGGDQRLDVREGLAAECLDLRGQALLLPVRKLKTAECELFSKPPVLFLEIVDDVSLLPVDSAGHGHDEEPERLRQLTHNGRGWQVPCLASPAFSGSCHTEIDGAPQVRGVVLAFGHYEIDNDKNS